MIPSTVSHPGGHDAPTDLHSSQRRIREFWGVLVARRRVVIATAVAVVATVMVLTFLATPEYQSTATIQVETTGPEVLNFKDVVAVDQTYTGNWKFYQTQYKLMRSRAVLEGAARELDLPSRPEFVRKKATPVARLLAWLRGSRTTPPAATDLNDAAIGFLQAGLAIRPVRDSQLVEISFTHSSPELARDVAREVTEAYMQFVRTSGQTTTKNANEFLVEEVIRVQDEISDLEREIQVYSRQRNIVPSPDGTDEISEQALADTSRRHLEARARLAVAEARLASVRDAVPGSLPEVLNSPLIARLKEQNAEIERRYGQMAERFKDNWPPLMQLRTELEKSRERLDVETLAIARQVRQVAEADHERARGEASRFEAELTKQRGEVQRIQDGAVEYAGLRAEITTKRNILAGLVARQSQAATSGRLKETETSNVRLVDPPQLPKAPVSPRKLVNLALSVLGGLFFGTAMAFVLEHLDNTVKNAQDVVKLSGFSLLAHVPLHQPLQAAAGADEPAVALSARVDLASHLDTRSAFAEAFKSLRTSLLLAAPDHPPRNLMITSCQPRDGKSTVSLNLAVVLTQLGKRVVIVDADLRVPRLHKVLGMSNGVGLSSYLSGNSALDDIVATTEVPNLYAIPSGPIPPNPSELLGSPRLGALMEQLTGAERFDFLLFDSSPLLSVADAFIVATRVDATILVVRAGETTREALQHAGNRLRQTRARVAGAVLNGVTEQSGDYYYGRYRYGYVGKPSEAKPSRRKRASGAGNA